MKNKLKKIIKPIFCIAVVSSLIFVPFPYSFIIASCELFGVTAAIIAIDFINNKKQKQPLTKNEIKFEEYKSDRKKIANKAMEIEETYINGITYSKTNKINNGEESYEK